MFWKVRTPIALSGILFTFALIYYSDDQVHCPLVRLMDLFYCIFLSFVLSAAMEERIAEKYANFKTQKPAPEKPFQKVNRSLLSFWCLWANEILLGKFANFQIKWKSASEWPFKKAHAKCKSSVYSSPLVCQQGNAIIEKCGKICKFTNKMKISIRKNVVHFQSNILRTGRMTDTVSFS